MERDCNFKLLTFLSLVYLCSAQKDDSVSSGTLRELLIILRKIKQQVNQSIEENDLFKEQLHDQLIASRK